MFIHDALCDYITCGDTSVPANELKAVIETFERVDQSTGRTGFQEQFAVREIDNVWSNIHLNSFCNHWILVLLQCTDVGETM